MSVPALKTGLPVLTYRGERVNAPLLPLESDRAARMRAGAALTEEVNMSEDNRRAVRRARKEHYAPVRERIQSILHSGPIHRPALMRRLREAFPDHSTGNLAGVLSGMCRAGTITQDRGLFDLPADPVDPTGVEYGAGTSVGSEEPPAYIVGDDDDGEIPEPPFSDLRVPQDAESGLNAIMGQWPGDETEEEVAAALQRPGTDLPPAAWGVLCSESWTAADTEADARRIAESQAWEDMPATIYRKIGTCRMRVEWEIHDD